MHQFRPRIHHDLGHPFRPSRAGIIKIRGEYPRKGRMGQVEVTGTLAAILRSQVFITGLRSRPSHRRAATSSETG